MKILDTGRKTYPEDPTRHFDFARFETRAGNFLLVEGLYDFKEFPALKGKKIVYIEFEEPNRFAVKDPLL